jgi:hypothetical protein
MLSIAVNKYLDDQFVAKVARSAATHAAGPYDCFNATSVHDIFIQTYSVACIQLWSLHEQCHQSGWGVVSLLYLLACALQYRYLDNTHMHIAAAYFCACMHACMQVNLTDA